MSLLKIARVPPVALPPEATALEAAEAMASKDVGAVVVVDPAGRPVGLVSEGDLVRRVLAEKKDPAATRLADVMTTEVRTIVADTPSRDAMGLIMEGSFRHLPIVDGDGRLVGVLSVRQLLEHLVGQLEDELNALDAYLSIDGIGGD